MLEKDLDRLAGTARRLSFDFSERPWPYIAEHAPKVDIAILSAASAEADPRDLVTRVAALGPSLVAVTQGAAGATLWADGQLLHAPAGAGPVVDTLGAGDAFIARLLVGLARGEEPADLLGAATAYASASCRVHGAFGYRTPLPDQFTSPGEVNASQ
jgi:fructoselysine 6-kinase